VFILLKIVFSGKSLWYIDNKFKIFLMKYWMGETVLSTKPYIVPILTEDDKSNEISIYPIYPRISTEKVFLWNLSIINLSFVLINDKSRKLKQ